MNMDYSEYIPECFRKLGKIEKTGQGSTGHVYKISGASGTYALKVVDCGENKQKQDDSYYEQAIQRSLCGCKHIVQLRDFYIDEFSEGRLAFLLEDYAAPLPSIFRPHSVSEVLKVIQELLDAVSECLDHGVLHLDLKPANLFFAADGTLLLGDFSSSLKMSDLASDTRTRGTYAYMAPEVFYEHKCSISSEIYSIGILLYIFCNGYHSPFGNRSDFREKYTNTAFPPLPIKNDQLRSRIEAVISKACAPEPSARYRTPGDFSAVLSQIEQDIRNAVYSPDDLLLNTCSNPQALPSDPDTTVTTGNLSSSSFSWSSGPVFDADPFASSVLLNIPGTSSQTKPESGAGDTVPLQQKKTPKQCHVCGSALVPNALFCPFCGTRIPTDRISTVEYSALYSDNLSQGRNSKIDIYMYEPEFRVIIEEFLRQPDRALSEERSGMTSVTEGDRIKVVLSSPDIGLAETEEQFWKSSFLKYSFLFSVPTEYTKSDIAFSATVYRNDFPVTDLKFLVSVNASAVRPSQIYRKDFRSAFVCYAAEDKERITNILRGIRTASPDQRLTYPLESLRADTNYHFRVKDEIESNDIFYLFWSGHAKASREVNHELKYALAHKSQERIVLIPLVEHWACPFPSELDCNIVSVIPFFDADEGKAKKETILLKDNISFSRNRKVLIADGKEAELTSKEFEIINLLSDLPGRIYSHEIIIHHAWGQEYEDSAHEIKNLYNVISRLNKKVKNQLNSESELVTSHNSQGYAINPSSHS